MLVWAAAVGLSGGAPPFFFVQYTLNTASIMFTYYYRIWAKSPSGYYDTLEFQGSFQADSLEEAHSRALHLIKMWGECSGDISLEYATSAWARSPFVVYFPPF